MALAHRARPGAGLGGPRAGGARCWRLAAVVAYGVALVHCGLRPDDGGVHRLLGFGHRRPPAADGADVCAVWPRPAFSRCSPGGCGCGCPPGRSWGERPMEAVQHLMQGFALALAPVNLLFAFIGSLLGTMVGVLPGLGPAATISLLLPLTFAIGSPLTSIIMLAGIYYGAMYGGSTTSILLNIPGEAASVVTCIDGYQMARQGRAGKPSASPPWVLRRRDGRGRRALLRGLPPRPVRAQVRPAGILRPGAARAGARRLPFGRLGRQRVDHGGRGPGARLRRHRPHLGKFRFAYGVLQLQDGFDFVTIAMGLFGLSEIFINLETAAEDRVGHDTRDRAVAEPARLGRVPGGPLRAGPSSASWWGCSPGAGRWSPR